MRGELVARVLWRATRGRGPLRFARAVTRARRVTGTLWWSRAASRRARWHGTSPSSARFVRTAVVLPHSWPRLPRSLRLNCPRSIWISLLTGVSCTIRQGTPSNCFRAYESCWCGRVYVVSTLWQVMSGKAWRRRRRDSGAWSGSHGDAWHGRCRFPAPPGSGVSWRGSARHGSSPLALLCGQLTARHGERGQGGSGSLGPGRSHTRRRFTAATRAFLGPFPRLGDTRS